MQIRRSVAVLVAVGALAYTAAYAAEPAPKLRLTEVEDIAPIRYRADLSLDPDKPTFAGSIRIELNVKKASRTIWLNVSKIKIEDASLEVGGQKMPATATPNGDDFVALQFGSDVPAGTAALQIKYTGEIRQGGSSGIFQATDGGEHYLLTQFEQIDARDAFPCFDEPSYKVPWQLTIHVPEKNKAVSNTPVVSEKTEGGTRTYIFKETKPLPSYLIAFAVGPFEFVDAGFAGKNRAPVRIVTPKGRAREAKYAAEVTATILTRLEQYFGIPFPYEKSDQVSVPVTIGFGAMENAGMVTYGQTIILAKPETDTINRQRGYASVAAHELAHQWFGDLVTTSWWNDIWLNEAFATWMEQKLLAEWKPEWKTRMDDVDAKLGAQQEDSLVSARRIRQAIESKDDIANAFDGITYQKGAAVIGMFENWMGPENFRKGVQSYMKQYAFQTTTAGEFLDSLSSAGKKEVSKPFSSFLNQAGVPNVSVALDCQQGAPVLHLEQTRFLPIGSKGSADQVWDVPVCVRYGSGDRGQSECTLMTQAKMDWPLKNAKSCPAWVEANDNAKGYYRMDYQGGLLTALTQGNVTSRLNAPERVDLIGNAEAMADAGKIAAPDALGLVETFHADPERDVVERALGVAMGPRENLVPDDLFPNYQRFLNKNFGARAKELGWIPRPGESDDVRLLRPRLVAVIATYGGDQDLAKQARQLAEQWLQDRKAVSPDVAGAVLRTAGYYGDAALYNQFLAEFEKTQDRQDQQRLLGALTNFRDRAALESGMQAVLTKKVSLADGFPLLFGGGGSASTRKMPFEFVKTNFDVLMKDKPSIFGFDFGSFLPRVGQSFCDEESRNELHAFFGPIANQYTGAPRTLDQVEEGISVCLAIKNSQQAGVTEFLRKY